MNVISFQRIRRRKKKKKVQQEVKEVPQVPNNDIQVFYDKMSKELSSVNSKESLVKFNA